MPSFAALGVPHHLCVRLDALGISEPFPVQAATIPDALAGRDVSGEAPTGSGKTIAFGLPLAAKVGRARNRRPRALVLVPTRELAAQVSEQLAQLLHGSDRSVVAIYGGAPMGRQIKRLASGAEIAVATPGRLEDLINQGAVRLDEVDIVVVDEADRMADMGFLPAVRRILDQVRPDRQTLLFSATLGGDVDQLVRAYQRHPVRHRAEPLQAQGHVDHQFWSVSPHDRVAVTAGIVTRSWPAIVFCRTKHGAERVAKQLNRTGVRAQAIHGDRSQGQRERALAAFASGAAEVLVATDVAARGIHVDDVACIVQLDPPATDKDYIHRSGRTGRAGAPGTVITLVTPDKANDVRKMQRALGMGTRLSQPEIGGIKTAERTRPVHRDLADRATRPRGPRRPESERQAPSAQSGPPGPVPQRAGPLRGPPEARHHHGLQPERSWRTVSMVSASDGSLSGR